jgi:hydroxymethylglutaryl-CoA reductase (NADPH)
MTSHYRKAGEHLTGLLNQSTLDELADRLLPSDEQLSARLTRGKRLDASAVQSRWQLLADHLKRRLDASQSEILDQRTASRLKAYEANIENFIGTAEIPIGLAGPMRVRGVHANGDYYVPLATTEAALVASYTRGAQMLSLAGGCRSAVVGLAVTRAPVFLFENLTEVGRFVQWVVEQFEPLKSAAEQTTRFGRLTDLRINVEANHVYLVCEYTTGDASGQNMVTIATEALCQTILSRCPVKPQRWFIESNMSGDKKAAAICHQGVRGRKVTAEAVLPPQLIARRLHTDAAAMEAYWRVSSMGGVMSGTIGVQGHYANALAAMYIALGQDAACVAESAIGVTRFERTTDGGLYVAVTLPAIMVGTVGGGSGLPSARACLSLLGLPDEHPADALAEIVGAVALAGEVSIIAAIASGQFTQAHQQLARDRRPSEPEQTGSA